MYTIYVSFKCLEGKREDFVTRVRDEGILDAVKAEDGFIRYDYYFSESDPNELLLVEAWASKEAQQLHITQEHMARLRAFKNEYIESSVLGEFELK